MNCCQSAILSFAFGVWVEPTFSEVDVYVERAILLHALQKGEKGENIVCHYNCLHGHIYLLILNILSAVSPNNLHRNRSLFHPGSRSPLGCPFLCNVRNSHPHSPLWSSLHKPGPCGTKTVPLCC